MQISFELNNDLVSQQMETQNNKAKEGGEEIILIM